MKRLLVLLFTVILSISVFAATGCGKANKVVDNSLNYQIKRASFYDDIDGSFKIKVNSGIVVNVKFTIVGLDSNGNELWSRNFDKFYRGFEPQNESYTIEFSCSYWYDDYGPERTNSIYLTDVKLIKENSNEWMGWTFGAVSAAATAAVITFFVLSKLKSAKEESSKNSD